jgi:hypothetical protein
VSLCVTLHTAQRLSRTLNRVSQHGVCHPVSPAPSGFLPLAVNILVSCAGLKFLDRHRCLWPKSRAPHSLQVEVSILLPGLGCHRQRASVLCCMGPQCSPEESSLQRDRKGHDQKNLLSLLMANQTSTPYVEALHHLHRLFIVPQPLVLVGFYHYPDPFVCKRMSGSS